MNKKGFLMSGCKTIHKKQKTIQGSESPLQGNETIIILISSIKLDAISEEGKVKTLQVATSNP